MEFDARTTGVLFALPLLVIVLGTVSSPMPVALSVGISLALGLFGVVSLVIGIRHGEYRAKHRL